MLELLAQVVTAAAVLAWVWWMPNVLVGLPALSPPRWLRRALAGVKRALTWPGRSQAQRDAAQTALIAEWKRQHPRHREMMIVGPPMGVSLLSTDGFEPGIRPPEPQPSIFAPPSGWAPAMIARQPTRRCDACPDWGCLGGGAQADGQIVDCDYKDTQPHLYRPGCTCDACSQVADYDEITTHDRVEPVGWERAWAARDRLDAAQRTVDEAARQSDRDGLAAILGIARLPRPGDDEIAKPPRDLFDTHIPPPAIDRPPRRPPEKRPAASLPCPFCGAKPVADHGGWRQVHRKRCALYKRPPRRPRPSGAQRRKLRDRIKDALDGAAREQLAKDLARAREMQGRAGGRLIESLRGELGKSRQCGACDEPVRHFEDEPLSIRHAVGCPRRSWPLDRATLPRPGHAPRAGQPPHTVDEAFIATDAAISCGCYDVERHRPPSDPGAPSRRLDRRLDSDGMRPYKPVATDRVRR